MRATHPAPARTVWQAAEAVVRPATDEDHAAALDELAAIVTDSVDRDDTRRILALVAAAAYGAGHRRRRAAR